MKKKLLIILTTVLTAGFVGSVVAAPPDAASNRQEEIMLKSQIIKCMKELVLPKLNFNGPYSSSFTPEEINMALNQGRKMLDEFINEIKNDTNVESLKAFEAELKKYTAGRSGS